MVKRIATLTLVLLLSLTAFAATPTGTVFLSYATGACPQPSGQHFDTQTLDASGNYSSLPPNLTGTLAVGTYCIIAVYSGDANFNGSTGYQTLTVVPVQKSNTATAVVLSPNPMVVGASGVTVSGGVVGQ